MDFQFDSLAVLARTTQRPDPDIFRHYVEVVNDQQEEAVRIQFDELAKINLAGVLARPRKRLAVTHPGQFLLTEFMEPHGVTVNVLANALHVPANRIAAILKGRRRVTADMAARLARYFGTTPDFWLNLQKDFELRAARESTQ